MCIGDLAHAGGEDGEGVLDRHRPAPVELARDILRRVHSVPLLREFRLFDVCIYALDQSGGRRRQCGYDPIRFRQVQILVFVAVGGFAASLAPAVSADVVE